MTRPPRPGATPWGLIGMLALVWAVEGFVGRREAFAPMLAACWSEAARASAGEAVGADVLFLGDSQMKLGVLPTEFTARTGRRAYNLAVHRGLAASSELLLRRALGAGARPRAVLIDAFPGLLASKWRLDAPLWSRLAGPRDLLALILRGRDPSLGPQVAGSWLLPSYGLRAEVRGAVAAALRGEPAPEEAATRAFRDAWARNSGAQPAEPRPAPPDDPAGPTTPWSCRPENEAALRRTFALAASRGIAVYWLLPPLNPATQARRLGNGREHEFDRFVEKVRADFPALVVLDGRRLPLDPSQFVDPVHLDRIGASALTAAVAEAVGPDARPPSSRWVDLSTTGVKSLASRKPNAAR